VRKEDVRRLVAERLGAAMTAPSSTPQERPV
jgi:hypothetical protein